MMKLRNGICLIGLALCLVLTGVPAFAGPISWLKSFLPEQPKPEDPHVYPEGSMLHDIWTCKGESDVGWVGVTQHFTDHDPYVVVVARTEFEDRLGLDLQVGIEIIAPRHNRIVANDRVILKRNQDVAIFYHPRDLARLGGWGDYKVVLVLDGVPLDEIDFKLEKTETLLAQKEEEERQKATQAAFQEQILGENLEAKSLLGEPDVPAEGSLVEAVGGPPVPDEPIMEVWEPEEWYRTDFDDEEGRIIVFPKKVRKTWRQNVKSDLRHRIQYYTFL
jgi:hypothetical protein